MRQTIIGLYDNAETPEELTSNHREDETFQVANVQEDLNGRVLYTGEAAERKTEEENFPTIEEDGSIGSEERTYSRVIKTEWFAVLDVDPAFICVSSGDGRFVFEMASLVPPTDPPIVGGAYNLDSLANRWREEYDAEFWAVNWSNSDGSGSYFPEDDHRDSDLYEKALRGDKKFLGFSFAKGGTFYKGIIAWSGYLQLFEPDFDSREMATFVADEVLQHTFIPSDE